MVTVLGMMLSGFWTHGTGTGGGGPAPAAAVQKLISPQLSATIQAELT